MIVCVSANPGIDRRICVPGIQIGAVNRVRSATAAGGGKAGHVALALHALGAESVLVGFLGGATGAECEADLREHGVHVLPVRTAAATRVNLEIIDDSGAVTELLEPGGPVTPAEATSFLHACQGLLQHGEPSVLAISGSLPAGLPADFYLQLVDTAHERSHVALVDTSSEPLQQVLRAKPDLVKVNRSEAAAVVGRRLEHLADTVWAARQLQSGGARSVAISCGADGLVALMRGEADPFVAHSTPISTHSAVGCGDATLAGFAAAYSRRLDTMDTLRLAVACGAANCLAPGPGRIDASHVQVLMKEIHITALGGSDAAAQ
jgi:1-phosphofructokinase family hexose kinase